MRDRTALIVGAANEVGRAISVRCATSGARLVLVDADLQGLNRVAHDVEEAGSMARVIAIDPTDPDSVDAAMAAMAAKRQPVHILVNNVDDRDGVPISEGTLETWERSLRANTAPVISFCLNVIPLMRKERYGRIVNVGSLEYLGAANQSNYSASKAAIFGLSRAFALELAREGITVNQVLMGGLARAGHSAEDEQRRAMRLPVQRLGTADDIAYAVAYFASASSRYVTGQNLIVCGGESIYSSMSA